MSSESSASGDTWRAVRKRVLDRDGHACRFCGIGDDEHRDEYGRGLTAHHVIPEADGGRDHPDNLITVCESCHRTLESTHAKAVGEMKRREDHAADLEGLTRVWCERWQMLDDLDDALAEFADGHPVFADEFSVWEDGGHVKAREFEAATAHRGQAQIESEWGFAVAWGFKEGVLDVVSALDGWTDVPFEDGDMAAESGE